MDRGTMLRRCAKASAVALGAAIAFLPAPGSRENTGALPFPALFQRRPLDPVAREVMERLPSLSVRQASQLAGIIREESEAGGLDPVLVLAVIGVESGWEPGAVSARGARGLMQLRRVAFETEAQEAGLEVDDAHDPIQNVRLGIRYLARMVSSFEDVNLGLVAYNAGPTRLSTCLRQVGEVPDEMQAYARKVRREERRIRREMLHGGEIVAQATR